jgi:hypothetical protein
VPRILIRLAARTIGARFPLTLEQIARAPVNKHLDAPPSLPDAVRPRIGVEEGLSRLAAGLAAHA